MVQAAKTYTIISIERLRYKFDCLAMVAALPARASSSLGDQLIDVIDYLCVLCQPAPPLCAPLEDPEFVRTRIDLCRTGAGPSAATCQQVCAERARTHSFACV